MTASIDLNQLRQWIGRSEQREELISPWTATAVAAVLRDDDEPWRAGRALPPLWHWACFLPAAPQSQLGADGHPARGGFLPPVPLPRRMWAGSRLEFFAPLRVGEPARKTATVADVALKQGKAGALVFVTVMHEVHDTKGALLLRDTHDIVYREAPRRGEPAPPPQTPPSGAAWTAEHHPDPTLLFRYSALTFNGHRIHYDLAYATGVEGYADLVVHGPLIATLMLEAAQRQHPGRRVRGYRFKAVRPLVCNRPLILRGGVPGADGELALWAEDAQGALLQQASAILE